MRTFTPFPPARRDYNHPICMALARELRELRVASGLSLCELSRPCDVSDECIRLIESGECVPTMDRAARIAVLAGLGFRLRIPRDA